MGRPYSFQASMKLDREGKRSRSIDVIARRYPDGAFQGCVRVPSLVGDTTHRCEISPREAQAVRELVADTTTSLKTALMAQQRGRDVVGFYDVVGHSYDIIGQVTPAVARPVIHGIGGRYDIVGFDVGSLIGGLTQAAGAIGQAVSGQGGPASTGGGSSGTGAGQVNPVNLIGSIAGAAIPLVGGIIQSAMAAGQPGPQPTSPEEYAARRERALRELAGVVAAGTHPIGSDNWRGALEYHVRNYGITPAEAQVLASDQSALARLDAQSPFVTPAGGTVRDPSSTPWRGAPPVRSVASMQQAATSPEALARDLRSPAAMVGVAQAQTNTGAQQAGAALGASELLARALASLAIEAGRSPGDVREAARIASAALRSVDAVAGMRAGDPRAREALRRAVNASAARTARALNVGLTLLGQS